MPGEALFVKVDDQLRALHSAQLRRDQHGFVAVLPLDQEGQFAVDVGGADDLVGVEPAVERILFVAVLCALVLGLSLVIRMFVIVIRLLTLRVVFLGLLFTNLLLLGFFWLLYWWRIILGRVVGLSLLLLAPTFFVFLGAHGGPVGARAEASLFCGCG